MVMMMMMAEEEEEEEEEENVEKKEGEDSELRISHFVSRRNTPDEENSTTKDKTES